MPATIGEAQHPHKFAPRQFVIREPDGFGSAWLRRFERDAWRLSSTDSVLRMMQFFVVPRGRGYWIDMTTEKTAPWPVERYNTAVEAIERRRALQQRADDIANPKLMAKGE